MNIAFLNSIEKETFGGMEEWIRLVSEGLLQRGHTVTLIGRKDSLYLRRISAANNSVRTYELSISGDFNPATVARIMTFISLNRVDVLSVNFNKDVRLGGLAARLGGKAKVVWSVGINLARSRFGHRFLTPRLVDRVIVPSQSLKAEITRFGYIDSDIVEVIPIGIPGKGDDRSEWDARSELRRKYDLPADVLVAVTSGRFVDQKGHIYLIEAAKEIVSEYPRIRFLLLGNGPLEQALGERVELGGMRDYFVFAGLLDNVELELAGSDLMVHPSIEEPFGIALLEGMRAGLPIVASRVGGIPEVVAEGRTALLVEPRKPGELAAAVGQLLADPLRRKTLGGAGRERWQADFRYEVMLDRIENHLKAVVDGNASG